LTTAHIILLVAGIFLSVPIHVHDTYNTNACDKPTSFSKSVFQCHFILGYLSDLKSPSSASMHTRDMTKSTCQSVLDQSINQSVSRSFSQSISPTSCGSSARSTMITWKRSLNSTTLVALAYSDRTLHTGCFKKK